MVKVLVINGSYRNEGITDQTVKAMVECLKTAGAEVRTILLRDCSIAFCLNCRECTQLPGEAPGQCIQRDDMQELTDWIEESEAFILASPTNFDSATALFKRFMERLIVYAYWPWDMNAPKFRKARTARKKAILISSCAAPGLMGRWLFNTHKQLKMTARTIGADTVGTIFTGLIASSPHHQLSDQMKNKAIALANRLL